MKLLFATSNKSKATYYQDMLSGMQIDVLSLGDLNVSEIEIEESGLTPEANARLKVGQYWNLVKMPLMAVDYGLYIDNFSQEKQPGMQVRRVGGKRLNDQEMLDYYCGELKKVGGESEGRWTTGMAIMLGKDKIFSSSFDTPTFFVDKICLEKNEGEPLNSIQYVRELGKHKAQLSNEEKSKLVVRQNIEIKKFIEDCLMGY